MISKKKNIHHSVKKIAGVLVVTLLSLAVMVAPVYADYSVLDGNISYGSNQNGYASQDLNRYNATNARTMVRGMRAYAYFVAQRAPFRAPFQTTDGNIFLTNRDIVLLPAFITSRGSFSTGTSSTKHYIYMVACEPGVNIVNVDGIPEEWGAVGANITITASNNIYGVAVYSPAVTADGYVIFELVRGVGDFNFGSGATRQTIQLSNATSDKEVILYAENGVGAGYNEYYPYGSYGDYDGQLPYYGYTRWADSYLAFANGVTSGGFTQDDLDDAYDDGYMDGEQIGYHQGAQDGYATGYANGYDEGYSFSAGAEEIESAYEDGKADGITEGYATGKADGVAEGYANGYDVGYDNGLETGYEDGKADGITEGYATGKADGVAEGYANGYDVGYDTGYDTGYDEGYDYGYNLGESVGSTKIDIGEIISAVPEGAKSIINGALGFEIFGINVAGTLTAILVVAIVAFVVKKLMTR